MKGSIVKRKYFIQTMEKYKVARIQYLPAIEDMIDTLIVSVKQLPRKLQVGGQTGQFTKMLSFNSMNHSSTESVVQWNTQGISTAKQDILKLIEIYQHIIMGFQKTYLANDCHITLKPYNCISKQRTDNKRYHGGVAVFMDESCSYEEIELNSQYQIVAARVHIGRQNAVTFANIYISESAPLDLDELCRITNDLPKPTVILGNFNAHGKDWGNKH